MKPLSADLHHKEDQISVVIGHEEYDFAVNPLFSLKFHLEKRVEAAGLDMQIPFNLNSFTDD